MSHVAETTLFGRICRAETRRYCEAEGLLKVIDFGNERPMKLSRRSKLQKECSQRRHLVLLLQCKWPLFTTASICDPQIRARSPSVQRREAPYQGYAMMAGVERRTINTLLAHLHDRYKSDD